MDKSGPAGLFIDLLENIAKKEDWKLNYHYGKWSDVFDQLKSKRIDILPVVAFKVSRKKNIDYTAETLLSNFGQVYKRKGLQLDSIQDLSGKTIATQPNDNHRQFDKVVFFWCLLYKASGLQVVDYHILLGVDMP